MERCLIVTAEVCITRVWSAEAKEAAKQAEEHWRAAQSKDHEGRLMTSTGKKKEMEEGGA